MRPVAGRFAVVPAAGHNVAPTTWPPSVTPDSAAFLQCGGVRRIVGDRAAGWEKMPNAAAEHLFGRAPPPNRRPRERPVSQLLRPQPRSALERIEVDGHMRHIGPLGTVAVLVRWT